MNREELDVFLADPSRNVILACVNQHGDPVQIPLGFLWADGKIYMSTGSTRGFFPNVRRHPRVALCVDDPGPPYRTVLMRGDCRIIEGEEHWAHTRRLLAGRGMAADAVEERIERMRQESRLILEVSPTMITSWTGNPLKRHVWRPESQ